MKKPGGPSAQPSAPQERSAPNKRHFNNTMTAGQMQGTLEHLGLNSSVRQKKGTEQSHSSLLDSPHDGGAIVSAQSDFYQFFA